MSDQLGPSARWVCDWNERPHRFCGGPNKRPSPQVRNEDALLLVNRKVRQGYALALHGLEVDADDERQVVHLRPRADRWVPVEDVMLSELAHAKLHSESQNIRNFTLARKLAEGLVEIRRRMDWSRSDFWKVEEARRIAGEALDDEGE